MSQGNPWITRTTPNVSIRGVEFGNDVYVAVGLNGTVITSPDAFTWTSRTSGNALAWWGIGYGKTGTTSTFIATNANNDVSTTNGLMSSTDNGVSWTIRTIPFAQQPYGVAYGNGVWCCCVIRDDTFVRSINRSTDNGITWSNIATPNTGGRYNWVNIATDGNGTWVTVSNRDAINNNIMQSTNNGLTWTLRTKSTNSALWGLNYGNGLFMAVSSTVSECFVSTNGATWTRYAMPAGITNWRSVVYGNGVWVAISANTSTTPVAYSVNDGRNWTLSTTQSSSLLWVCYGNGKYAAVRSAGGTSSIITWQGVANPQILFSLL